MYKVKVWIAKDISDEVRLYMDNPYFIDGYFYSEGRSWQLPQTEGESLAKGDKRVVYLQYEITQY